MRDCIIVGGGVAGLSAGLFAARAGLDTLVVSGGESILARNASLENYPGLPAGFDARRYLAFVREQAEDAGCAVTEDRIVGVETDGTDGEASGDDDRGSDDEQWFRLGGESSTYHGRRLVAASWPDSEYLVELGVDREQRGSKHVIAVDRAGRTSVDGVYAAGRIAGQPHQAIVAAGHGATVGLAVVQDGEAPFYHDWVAPEGYFTGRDREVPPACAEIDDEERHDREATARERLRERLGEPFEAEPTQHPSVDGE
ncbi:FAD-binding protein [Halovivax cerinus]|uniref:FAD-binding protein n=1 Tax=Halovivax cerinus TaxID=1487865 RepID=A0ABD5NJI6_9EURY|nr:FAD-binding protein [Halovivax cerinus]